MYSGSSEEHGIDEGEPYRKMWCCRSADNIWERKGQTPPCSICPNDLFLLPSVRESIQAFHILDMTGREMGFDMGHLREEAVDLYLKRFDLGEDVYFRLLEIDAEITAFRRENRPKTDKKE